MLLGRITPK